MNDIIEKEEKVFFWKYDIIFKNIYLIEYIESQNVVEKEEKNCSHYLFTLEIFLSIHY